MIRHAYPIYFCWEREGGEDDIKARKAIQPIDARKLLDIHMRLGHGQEVSYDELVLYGQGRVFHAHSDAADLHRRSKNHGGYCSCPMFQPDLRCFHTLSLSDIPVQADPTPLCAGTRRSGRIAKAKDRYAGPENLVVAGASRSRSSAQTAAAALQRVSAGKRPASEALRIADVCRRRLRSKTTPSSTAAPDPIEDV